MGSADESDRKRRHFSSISPVATTVAKKQALSHFSDDKKLSATVLEFQNQQLSQKLECQMVEYTALENRFSQLKEKQKPYDSSLKAVHKSWKLLVGDLEVSSNRIKESSIGQAPRQIPISNGGSSSPFEDALLSRLAEAGATECSSTNNSSCSMEDERAYAGEKTRDIFHNIVTATNNLWYLKDALHEKLWKEFPDEGDSRKKVFSELQIEITGLRRALGDIHLKHKSLARELQYHCDHYAKNKSELKHLKGDLERAVTELEDSDGKLTALRVERDATKGTFFPVLNLENKHVAGDRVRDKLKDRQELESALKELSNQASSRLLELKDLQNEREIILRQASNLQQSLKSMKYIYSSKPYSLLGDQLEKSKSQVIQFQALLKKLQVEKDTLVWKEKLANIKHDLVDVFRRYSSVADSRIADLGREMQKQIYGRSKLEAKLEEASRGPGRKEIITDFKALVSSFPEEMGSMQRQLSELKVTAVNIHSLRADVQALSACLERKTTKCQASNGRSASQAAEIQKLQSLVQDLKDSDQELKLILEMYQHESTGSSDYCAARDLENKAWAQVQSLKSILDEENLESRVKTANEAEAISQQRLAATEAEIVDLRKKLEANKRDISNYSNVLKSKNDANEAYISEIETIGQAYDDMLAQNQHLLQQITERDDYNIKLVLEGVRAKQQCDGLSMDKQDKERQIWQAKVSLDFGEVKAARIEDQLRMCSSQVQKLAEDKFQNSNALDGVQKRIMEAKKLSNLSRESLEEMQSKVERNRAALLELRIELEKERFNKRRLEEDLVIVQRKVSSLRAQGSSIIQKLQEELREYREIVKCNICRDRPKEVVITKCYHLFCNPCVQRIIEGRHRKCPTCSASFGANDVKPVYI